MKSGSHSFLSIQKLRYRLHDKPAFTIVELLVVIVVIGILATITLISYSGIQQKATVASLSSDLYNASIQLDMFQVDNGTLPLMIDCGQPDSTTNKCIKSSGGASYQYSSSNSSGIQTFCAAATIGSVSYKITQDRMPPSAGNCLGYGLVMHLDAGNPASYPGSGTAWTDLSGNGSNGTLTNGAAYIIDGSGAISFDGVNDYVSIPYGSQLNIRNAITLSIWVKRTSGFNQLQDTMILGRPPAWYFYDSYNSGNIHGDIYIDGVRRAARDVLVPFDGNWHQITYIYDSSNQTAKMYKNGSLASSTTLTGLTNYLIDSSVANFTNMGYNTVGRTMALNDAYIYNRALSGDEVTQLFDAHRSLYGL